jgi:hypothetical protein
MIRWTLSNDRNFRFRYLSIHSLSPQYTDPTT